MYASQNITLWRSDLRECAMRLLLGLSRPPPNLGKQCHWSHFPDEASRAQVTSLEPSMPSQDLNPSWPNSGLGSFHYQRCLSNLRDSPEWMRFPEDSTFLSNPPSFIHHMLGNTSVPPSPMKEAGDTEMKKHPPGSRRALQLFENK